MKLGNLYFMILEEHNSLSSNLFILGRLLRKFLLSNGVATAEGTGFWTPEAKRT